MAAVAAAGLLALSNDSSSPPTGGRATQVVAEAHPRVPRFGGALETCSTRSEANFPGAFTDPRNLVMRPLVLIGGAFTDASTVREYGGNKFPLLVEAGRTVTIRIARRARDLARLAYGPLPQGETRFGHAYRSVTFVACRPGKRTQTYSPDGPSGSYVDEVSVTFWSGFVLTRAPACIPLQIYVDDSRSPTHVGLPLGRRCGT
jgi:hypothetical protein